MKSTDAQNEKKILVAELEQVFVPMILVDGFARRTIKVDGKQLSQHVFPIGFFGRYLPDGACQCLDVQFDKRDRAIFTVRVGTIPANGVNYPWTCVPQPEAIASDALDAHQINYYPPFLNWFRYPPVLSKNSASAASVVQKLCYRYQEIQYWFRSGAIGKHMSYIGHAPKR